MKIQLQRTLIALWFGVLAIAASGASADGGQRDPWSDHHYNKGQRDSSQLFKWIGTFDVIAGNGSAVAEIVDVTADGKQLVYTDADNESIGFVDIRRPRQPVGLGTLEVGGEPTSLVISGPYVLVAVNTSMDFVSPSGVLLVIRLSDREVVAQLALAGQPDSIAIAPDGQRAAIVFENERDEDLDDGLLPQAPTGELLILSMTGAPAQWTLAAADLSPIAATAFAGGDLEPEFVDINSANLAVVTFQENNHLAVVDLVTGSTLNHFSAGSVILRNVDTSEESSLIELNTTIEKRREPDAVTWIDHDSFATANEGDYEDEAGNQGGSRSFTVFNIDGRVEYESNESFEHLLVAAGHYNEGRSENKGVEPESVEFARYGRDELLFVSSERSNALAIYDVSNQHKRGHGNRKQGKDRNRDTPVRLQQLLATGIGPEGLKAIPQRDLFVVATESDVAGDGIPTMINLYKRRAGKSKYPTIQSANDLLGLPIPWVALSGLAGDPWSKHRLYAVSDSFLDSGFIYSIDTRSKPAMIVDRLQVLGATADLDLEGIAVGPNGDFWLGSEGDASSRPNLVLQVDPISGMVKQEIGLPAGLVDNRRGNGIEGIALTGTTGAEIVYVAIQRAWPDEGDTDQVNTKIGRYDVASGTWSFVHYPLEAEGNGGWIGLSELSLLPDGSFAVIERDKGWGSTTPPNAELKAIYQVDLEQVEFRAFDDPAGLAVVSKTLLLDVLPKLAKRSVWTAEKLEGLGVSANGKLYVVTDNDGVDDAPGETLFLSLGKFEKLIRAK